MNQGSNFQQKTTPGREAHIQRLPHDYRALLAISTDLDGTRSADEYFELLRFWNTSAKSDLGQGLDLQLSNSIYFSMPAKAFSYWNASSDAKRLLRDCNRAGFVDSLHSYGELATGRTAIDECIVEIERSGMKFPVWSNHSDVVSNFWSAKKATTARGDDVDADAYHAKQTLRFGVRYVALGQVTSVVGQDVFPNPFRKVSAKSRVRKGAIKQLLKIAASPFSARYRAHGVNRVLSPITLKDGQPVFEILRTNWHPVGIGRGSSGVFVHEILSPQSVRELARCSGLAVIYTHLGQCFRLSKEARQRQADALRAMKKTLADQRVRVMTTSDLLDYVLLTRHIHLETDSSDSTTHVDLNTKALPSLVANPESIINRSGLTVSVKSREAPQLTIDGHPPRVAVSCERTRPGTWRMCLPMVRREMPAELAG
jgi:hypothetical protein